MVDKEDIELVRTGYSAFVAGDLGVAERTPPREGGVWTCAMRGP
jgi:hypothetical protein